MTAKEYLIKNLSDPYVEVASVQTRTALAAYAIRIAKGVDGYSISEVEDMLEEYGITDEKFIMRCVDFISSVSSFIVTYKPRIPQLDD